MKKLLLPLLFLSFLTSCIDKDYDLKTVNADNITIGGEGSTFRIPLAEIRITLKEIAKSGTDIQAMMKEANLWLPSPLPGGVDYVDLTRFSDATYTGQLTEGLIAQMQTNDAKLTAVTNLVWDKYKNRFLALLKLPDTTPAEQFKNAFKAAFRQSTAIQEEAKRLCSSYLEQITVETVSYALDEMNLEEEVINILSDNLDPKSTPASQRKNTLHLYGEVFSRLPFSLRLTPEFKTTDVRFPVEIDAKRGTNPIAESDATQLFADDLRRIIEGVDFNIPFHLEKYYPAMGFQDDGKPQVIITLRMVKRGGLQVNF